MNTRFYSPLLNMIHRFLSHKFGVDLDAFTLMVTPLAAKAVDGGDALQVRGSYVCNSRPSAPHSAQDRLRYGSSSQLP